MQNSNLIDVSAEILKHFVQDKNYTKIEILFELKDVIKQKSPIIVYICVIFRIYLRFQT